MRVATISLHTSPLAVLGGKDAGEPPIPTTTLPTRYPTAVPHAPRRGNVAVSQVYAEQATSCPLRHDFCF